MHTTNYRRFTMSTITVLGGTGYAGSHIVAAAASRGHDVVSVSRSADTIQGDTAVTYRAVDVTDADALTAVLAGADVVISALSPRGALAGNLRETDRIVGDLAAAAGTRLIVVGGFSSLRPAPDAPRIIDGGLPKGGDAPFEGADLDALLAEASEMNSILCDLLARTDDLNWTFASPGLEFGAHVPGEKTGKYRIDTTGVILADINGRSAIGGADFADALLDVVDKDLHHRTHIAVGY